MFALIDAWGGFKVHDNYNCVRLLYERYYSINFTYLALAAVVVSSRDSPVISYEQAPGEGGEEGLLFNSKRPYKTS